MRRTKRQHPKVFGGMGDCSATYRCGAESGRQAWGGPRAGAGPAWRLNRAGEPAIRKNVLALSALGSAAGADANGAAPPRHSTQCQPLADACAGALLPESPDCCTPDAEHTWCKSVSAGLAAKAGVMTAAASERSHQANTPAAKARAWRRTGSREGLCDMLVRGGAVILLR